ncbi:MAG: Uma2 family endonuclease, partial [Gammaproteobacteria bacterium]|nr:Uma2 family endonuclease [Gammaproteobacteria bacterium]
MTEAEYWDKYYEYPDMVFEWNNGCLEEKPVSDALTFMTYEWFWELLRHYLRTEPIAKTTGLEMGFNLALPRKKNTVRRPDLGIVLNSNPVPLLPTDKSYNGTYDLCIEAVSDSKKTDITRDTEVKNKEYAKTGVREYYILDGHDRYSGFYRLGAGGVYVPLPAKNGIVKSTVLPGFQFRTEDLYRCPPPVEMARDSVYQNFVLPGYITALQKADEAEQRAKEAEQRAEAGQLAVIEASARKKAAV